jgi:hypothetical protein
MTVAEELRRHDVTQFKFILGIILYVVSGSQNAERGNIAKASAIIN